MDTTVTPPTTTPPLTPDREPPPDLLVPPLLPDHAHGHRCGNCEALLTGPYCAECGQHAHASARTLAAVMHDAWHDLTHVDGRLWFTVWLLLQQPGRLTVDYFHERRARYLPPIRLYLVLSLVFFALPMSSKRGIEITPNASIPASGIHKQSAPTSEQNQDASGAPGDAQPSNPESQDNNGFTSSCMSVTFSGFPTLERSLRQACLRNIGRREEFVASLVHNFPRMMFVFLPLMAGVMALLYWQPRRYYVEHLVFLLHNHSALFLCFVSVNAMSLLSRGWHPIEAVSSILEFVVFFYVIWYPYAAMRVFYSQGRLLTFTKYATIAFAYFVCLIITLAVTTLLTALSH